MVRALLLGNLLVVAFVCSLTTTGARQAEPVVPSTPDRPSAAELTLEEERIAASLAEQALKEKNLLSGKVYLCKMDVFRDGRNEGSPRRVFLTYYRYEGHEAIQTCVDLARRQVVRVEVMPSFPTPLAPREATRAVELARNHPAVKKFLERHGKSILMEAFSIHSVVKGEPAYSHRVASISFKEDGYYLNEPRVSVDLTTETVLLRGPHMNMRKNGQ